MDGPSDINTILTNSLSPGTCSAMLFTPLSFAFVPCLLELKDGIVETAGSGKRLRTGTRRDAPLWMLLRHLFV